MLTFRNYEEGDYEKYIRDITKKNMQELFLENFGGWSDEVSAKKFFEIVKTGQVWLFFLENNKPGEFISVEDQNKPDEFVGYVSFGVEKNNEESYLIHDIHVLKKFQGKGHGKDILSYVEDFAMHKKQLKVFVFENNKAHLFYRKQGFVESEYLEKSKTFILVKTI